MTDPNKLDDVHLLNHLATATLASERSAYWATVVKRASAYGLDPKIAAALADGYVEASKKKNAAESISFEKELLRRMKPPESPATSAPETPTRLAAAPTMPLRSSEMPQGPPFERNSLHDFFLAVAEHNEQTAQEAKQFAILCRRMCEKIKPEMYKKDGEG